MAESVLGEASANPLERAVGDRHAPRSAGRVDAPEHRQVPLLMHGQGPHEHSIGDAEGGGGGANAERQRRVRESGEPWVPPQGPQPVADVLHCAQPRRNPDVADEVAGERQVAQGPPGREGRRGPIESARLQILLLHRQVELQLVVELTFVTISVEQVPQATE